MALELTFETVNTSPRRVAVRRIQRPAFRVIDSKERVAPAVAMPVRTGTIAIQNSRQKRELFIAVGLTIAVHAAIITAINRPTTVTPPLKKTPLTIEIAPPPKPELPPPPITPPKPVPPSVKKVAPPRPAPSVPVVSEIPVDPTPAQEVVQVATTPPPPTPAPAPVEEVTEPRGFAGYLHNPAPKYPAAAEKRGLEGQVLLRVHVLASGKPSSVTVAKSSGHDVLDQAAIKAVSEWTFDPARRGKTPIDGDVKVPITFKI